jgi:hypothetical protein
MKAEDEPVTEDEFVLRLIHPVYYKASLDLPVQPEAFRPLDSGEAGISVFRATCLGSPAQTLAALPEAKRPLYYIARLSVRDLRALKLSVRPDPIAAVPGHALLPELNTTDYQRDKSFWKQV